MTREPDVAEPAAGAQQIGFRHGAASSARRSLRDDGERERFAQCQRIGTFAEIDVAGGADALNVAAERHHIQISLENLVLRVSCFEPNRGGDLAHGLPAGVRVFRRYIIRTSCIVSVESPWRARSRYERTAARVSAIGLNPAFQ